MLSKESCSSSPLWCVERWSLRQTFAGVTFCLLFCQCVDWFLLPDHAVVRLPDSSRRSDCHPSGSVDHRSSRRGIPGLRSQGRRPELILIFPACFNEGLKAHQPRKHWRQNLLFLASVPDAQSRRDGMGRPGAVVPGSPRLKNCLWGDPSGICVG